MGWCLGVSLWNSPFSYSAGWLTSALQRTQDHVCLYTSSLITWLLPLPLCHTFCSAFITTPFVFLFCNLFSVTCKFTLLPCSLSLSWELEFLNCLGIILLFMFSVWHFNMWFLYFAMCALSFLTLITIFMGRKCGRLKGEKALLS